MYKRILVPTDGSDITGKAVQSAIALAKLVGAELRVIGVKEPFPYSAISEMQPVPPQEFYDAQGRWPRSWGDYRFTDIGYDPADWDEAVEGIFWNPNGYRLGLANYAGDNLQIYVNDLEGNTLHLYDGWNIWCLPGGGCYYHTVAPGNEVDIDTLLVVDLTSGLAQ